MKVFRILIVLFSVGYSMSALATVDLARCGGLLADLKLALQARAGFDERERVNFAAHGEMHPKPLEKELLGAAVQALVQLPPGGKFEGFNAWDIGRLIGNRNNELSSELQGQVEGLLESKDQDKVSASLLALEHVKGISPKAQLKIAELMGTEKFAEDAIDALSTVKTLSLPAFEKVTQLAAANARAGRSLFFTRDPGWLLRKIQPIGMEKDRALEKAGLTATEIYKFNKYGTLRPEPTETMGVSSLVGALVNLGPGEKLGDVSIYDVGRAIEDRHSEVTPQLQTEVEKLLSSNDADKVKAALGVLEKVPSLGVHTQEIVARLIGNERFAEEAIDVLEEHRTVAPSTYQIIAKMALDNARKGISIFFTRDPQWVLSKLKPDGVEKRLALETAGFTETEQEDFERFREIKPHPLLKMPLDQVVEEFTKLGPDAKFHGKNARDFGDIIKSRNSELTPSLITSLEGALESQDISKVGGTLLALEKVKIISPRAQQKIAQLVANKEVAEKAIDVLKNLKWVTAEAYTTVATLARKNAEQKIEIFFTRDPERLLRYIQPMDGVVSVSGEDVAASIDARKKIDDLEAGLEAMNSQKRMEQHMEEQRRTNPQVRTGETDISDTQRLGNLSELQQRASKTTRGSYINSRANSVSRWRQNVTAPEPMGSYSGVFTIINGPVKVYKGKRAIRVDTVSEYDAEFHYKFNLATMRSTSYTAVENGHRFRYREHGENPGWGPDLMYGEPEENKTVTEDLGHIKLTYVWKYVGDFTAPNGIKYKKCFKLTAFDSENKVFWYSIAAPGIGGVYQKGQGFESILEAISSK